MPLYVASLPIFSRAYYTNRNFSKSTLDIPLGSGPYRVGKFKSGRFIEFERVGIGGAPTFRSVRGAFNFDIVRFEFYRDRDVAFEGFTGRNYLYREEFTARVWSTRYDFPAIKDGRVKREMLPDETPSGAQGWFINTRRAKFADPRVREALCYAFDFEWTNKTIMYGAYARTHSPFQNSDMMAKGPPSPEELVLLEPFRVARCRRKCSANLSCRRCPMDRGRTARCCGAPLSFSPRPAFRSGTVSVFFRTVKCFVFSFWRRSLRSSRITRPTSKSRHPRHRGQPASRRPSAISRGGSMSFDFDMTIKRFSMSATRATACDRFSSQAAKTKGTQNLAGVANPAIDALIERIIGAENRNDLTIACRAFNHGYSMPGATGCRNGTGPIIRSPIGMCSGGRRSRRAISAATVR